MISKHSRVYFLPAVSLFLLSAMAGLAQTPFVVYNANEPGSLRNNYSGFVGLEFTVGSMPLQVTSLGRVYVPGNTGAHTLKIVSAQTGLQVQGAAVRITMTAGTPNTFQYAALPAPVQLSAGTSYFLLSQEIQGGDQWFDDRYVNADSTVGNINAAVYTDASGAYITLPNTANYSYVPPNFLYNLVTGGAIITITSPFSASITPGNTPISNASVQFFLDGQLFGSPVTSTTNVFSLYGYDNNGIDIAPGMHTLTAILNVPGFQPIKSPVFAFTQPNLGSGTAQPLIYNQTPGPLRNNYSGFVGFSFTTDSSEWLLRGLGRFAAPGNSLTHVVKLVDALTGIDVPGASITIGMAGSTPGAYIYGYFFPNALNGILLQPNHSYYLLSEETNGGDQWYDYGPVFTASIAINGPVYQAANGYVPVAAPGYSYVPVNLVRDVLSLNGATPSVSIVSPMPNAGLTGTVIVQVNATEYGFAQNIVAYQARIDNVPAGSPASSSSIPLDTRAFANGYHNLTVAATDIYNRVGVSHSIPILISNSSTGPAVSAFVSTFVPTFTRSNFDGYVGMQFTVGSIPIQIYALGRYCSNSYGGFGHTVKLVDAASGADIPGASVQLYTTSTGQYVYADLPNPVTLRAGGSYYLVDNEGSNYDVWYDYALVTTSNVAIVNGAVYSPGGAFYFSPPPGPYVTIPFPSTSYVPLNFLYSTQAPNLTTVISGVTSASMSATTSGTSPISSVQFQFDGYSLTPPVTTAPYTQTTPSINYGTHIVTSIARDAAGDVATSGPFTYNFPQTDSKGNQIYPLPLLDYPPNGLPAYNTAVPFPVNYTGFAGLQFTTGSAPYGSPRYIGRYCNISNVKAHLVKIVRASDGSDVPGASTWVMCSTAANQNYSTYGPITATLQPNTVYYLVSQEESGGDTFYDVSPVNVHFVQGPVSLYNFSIDGPVMWNGFQWVLTPQPNYGYAGVRMDGIQQ